MAARAGKAGKAGETPPLVNSMLVLIIPVLFILLLGGLTGTHLDERLDALLYVYDEGDEAAPAPRVARPVLTKKETPKKDSYTVKKKVEVSENATGNEDAIEALFTPREGSPDKAYVNTILKDIFKEDK